MTEDIFYHISGNRLLLSSEQTTNNSQHVFHHDDEYGDHVWPWTDNPDITKVVVEDEIAPSTCYCMFAGLKSLTSIEGLENLDTSHVTDMYAMFADDESLTSLDLSSFDTSNVTWFDSMLSNCSSLTEIDGLSNWDTGNAVGMAYMFNGCYLLPSLDLRSWDTSHVNDFTNMFIGCKSLDVVAAPANLHGTLDTEATSQDTAVSLDFVVAQSPRKSQAETDGPTAGREAQAIHGR